MIAQINKNRETEQRPMMFLKQGLVWAKTNLASFWFYDGFAPAPIYTRDVTSHFVLATVAETSSAINQLPDDRLMLMNRPK